MMRLYNKPQCPFCWKIRLALAELGLEVEIIDYQAPGQESIWRQLTPNSTVPVLVCDAGVIYESDIIMEYLADLTGQLLPQSHAGRIKARLLHKYSDQKIGAGLREAIFEKRDNPREQWDWQRINQGIQRYYDALAFLEKQLEEQEFFTGIYAFPEAALTARFALAEAYEIPLPELFPRLQAWFERMQQRPSFALTNPF